MMLALAILLTAVAVNNAQVMPDIHRDYRYNRNHGVYPYNYNNHHPYDETPKPYAFQYSAPLEDGVGQSSRTETADGTGKVEGSYTVTNDEGHTRVVDYVADELGFRASIRTNEPGTDNKNPADVTIDSAAPFTPYQYVPRYRNPYVSPGLARVSPIAAAVGPISGAVSPIVDPEVVPEIVQPGLYAAAPGMYPSRNYNRLRYRYPHARY